MNVSDYYNNYAASNAYSAQSAYSTQSVKGTASFLEITGDASGSKYASGADGVDISTQARELLDRARNLDVFSCIFPNNNVASGKYKSLDTLQSEFMSDFSSFSSAFGGIASSMGMTSADNITMGLDGKGGMTFSGSDDALASKLSGAMGSETTTARFAVMAARAALVDAGYTLDGFENQYNQDPVGAIEDNIDALKERLLGFRTTASGGQMQYGFMRDVDFEYSENTAEYELGSDNLSA